MTADQLAKDFPYYNNVNLDPRLLGGQASLAPFAQAISSSRLDMFASHLNQAMVLDGAEFPYIYAGPEQNLGQYEFSKSNRTQDIEVLEVIPKYPTVLHGERKIANNPSLTVIYLGKDDNKIHVMEIASYTKCSDGFGYKNVYENTHMLRPGVNGDRTGQHIDKDVRLLTSPIHKNGVYCLGVNANVAYMTSEDTIEDAMPVSRSFVNKCMTTEIHEHTITIDIDQHPLDLYGDGRDVKFLPDIGEIVRDDGILCAFRPIDAESFLSDVSPATLKTPQGLHDIIYYAPPGAEILDIDFYMARNAKAPKHLFTQVEKYLYATNVYLEKIVATYQIYKKTHELSPGFITLVTNAIERLAAAGVNVKDFPRRPKVKLIGKNKRPIAFIQVRITYMSKRPCQNGFKITGRDGAKGVVCRIVEDADMPVDDEGFRADIIIDPGSVFARMSLSQLYEQAINRTSEFVRRRIATQFVHDPAGAAALLLDYYNDINPNYAALVQQQKATPEALYAHVETCIRGGIYLHIPPGLQTISMALIKKLKTKWQVTISPVTFTDRDIDGSLIGTFRTKNNVCIGSKYLYLLCKIPDPSSPGVAHTNQYDTPMKSPPFDKIRHPIRRTPIRLGEDEGRISIMDLKDPREVMRLMCLQANSRKGVEALIEELLTNPHPTRINRINISNRDLMNSNTIIRLFRHLMATLGVASSTTGPYPIRRTDL